MLLLALHRSCSCAKSPTETCVATCLPATRSTATPCRFRGSVPTPPPTRHRSKTTTPAPLGSGAAPAPKRVSHHNCDLLAPSAGLTSSPSELLSYSSRTWSSCCADRATSATDSAGTPALNDGALLACGGSDKRLTLAFLMTLQRSRGHGSQRTAPGPQLLHSKRTVRGATQTPAQPDRRGPCRLSRIMRSTTACPRAPSTM